MGKQLCQESSAVLDVIKQLQCPRVLSGQQGARGNPHLNWKAAALWASKKEDREKQEKNRIWRQRAPGHSAHFGSDLSVALLHACIHSREVLLVLHRQK